MFLPTKSFVVYAALFNLKRIRFAGYLDPVPGSNTCRYHKRSLLILIHGELCTERVKLRDDRRVAALGLFAPAYLWPGGRYTVSSKSQEARETRATLCYIITQLFTHKHPLV